MSCRSLVEELESIEGVVQLRFVVMIVGSSSSNNSLFEGLVCDEFVFESACYKIFLIAWLGCGGIFVEC